MSQKIRGVSFPFRFNSSGGTEMTELTHEDHSLVLQSLYQIWFTSKNERLMEVDFGTPVRKYLFESNGDVTELAILRHEMLKAASVLEDLVVINDIRFDFPNDVTTVIYVDCTIVKFMLDTTLEMRVNLNEI